MPGITSAPIAAARYARAVFLKRVVEPVASDGTVRTLQYHAEDTHIVCPWHGYEYNIRTGEHTGHAAFKLRKAGVSVRNGEIDVVPG